MKNLLTKALAICLIVLMGKPVFSQSDPITSVGNDFKFVYLQNRILDGGGRMDTDHPDINLSIYVNNTEDDAVTVFFQSNETMGVVAFDHTSIDATNAPIYELSVPANSMERVDVVVTDYSDITQGQLMNNLEHQRKMIRVWTDDIIDAGLATEHEAGLTVFSESSQTRSRDAAMILPVDALGAHYFAFTGNRVWNTNNFPPENNTVASNNNGGPSEVGILAIENILVTIDAPTILEDYSALATTPVLYNSALSPGTSSDDRTMRVFLREGEAIQLQSDFYDLSGMEIRSVKWTGAEVGTEEVSNEAGICAVFAGNMATHIVNDDEDQDGSFDHIYEQMYPLNTWGCEYVGVNTQNGVLGTDVTVSGSTPYSNSFTSIGINDKKDFYKIMAGYDGTTISMLDMGTGSMTGTVTLNKGEYIYINENAAFDAGGNTIAGSSGYSYSASSHFMHVLANKPVGVAQYFSSEGVAGSAYYVFQDPSMSLLSPLSQRLDESTFSSLPWEGNVQTNYANPYNFQCGSSATKRDYVTIIADVNEIAELEINNNPASLSTFNGVSTVSTWNTLGSSDWRIATVDITNSSSDPNFHSIRYKSSFTGTPNGFISYAYGFNCRESYSYATGINAAQSGTNPLYITECLEPGISGVKVDKSTLNDALVAFGGNATTGNDYTWSLVSVPDGFTTTTIGSLINNVNAASPNFLVDLDVIGDYVFSCLIVNDATGACDISYEVTVRVPSCCDVRLAGYDQPSPEIVNFESWNDRMFIEDFTTVVVRDGAELNINNADVVFGRCAAIEVERGGILRANNSVFRACDPASPWSGIRFTTDGASTNENASIFNECTFKNAVKAIQIENEESVSIQSNLFYNNYTGIDINSAPQSPATRSEYNKHIAGNKFIIDNQVFNIGVSCADDNGTDIVAETHYGIQLLDVNVNEKIANNEFNNTITSSETRKSVGVYMNNAKAHLSSNTFTELYHSVQADNSDLTAIRNVIEVTDKDEDKAQIDVRNATDNTEIRSNELICWGTALKERAMYISDCENVEVVDNSIKGFDIGIVTVDLRTSLISQNTIKDAVSFGIYSDGILGESGAGSLTISCNTINMDMNRLDQASVGIGTNDWKHTSKISSNCIFDCMVSVYMARTTLNTGVPAPIVENNFLYNYDWAGIYFFNTANTLTSYDEKVRYNTYYSNSHGYDIVANHSSDIYVENSFGLSEVTSNIKLWGTSNARFSTASCGSQIYRLGMSATASTTFEDLSRNYNIESFKCDDNYSSLMDRFADGDKDFDNETWHGLISSIDLSSPGSLPGGMTQGDFNQLIARSFENGLSDKAVAVFELSQSSDLSDEEKLKISFDFHLRTAAFDKAQADLSTSASTKEMARWTALATLRLKVARNQGSFSVLSTQDVAVLQDLATTLDAEGSAATSLLNALQIDANLKYVQPTETERPNATNRMSTLSNNVTVYPNPATESIDIQYAFQTSEIAQMVVVDIYGKEVNLNQPGYMVGTATLDVNGWDSGVYFVNVTLENGEVHSTKFVKL